MVGVDGPKTSASRAEGTLWRRLSGPGRLGSLSTHLLRGFRFCRPRGVLRPVDVRNEITPSRPLQPFNPSPTSSSASSPLASTTPTKFSHANKCVHADVRLVYHGGGCKNI
ncbi:unnamed protein product [Protopolystoma xenopodis]|uniref:Uncharacterized protein n=1 Tax=Protopolystoma xenopodis TaxID=117903 RepID=A0A448X3J0_9PLAT|nr:unnamed protein product [Protopolystoma xenopodis]